MNEDEVHIVDKWAGSWDGQRVPNRAAFSTSSRKNWSYANPPTSLDDEEICDYIRFDALRRRLHRPWDVKSELKDLADSIYSFANNRRDRGHADIRPRSPTAPVGSLLPNTSRLGMISQDGPVLFHLSEVAKSIHHSIESHPAVNSVSENPLDLIITYPAVGNFVIQIGPSSLISRLRWLINRFLALASYDDGTLLSGGHVHLQSHAFSDTPARILRF